MISGVIAGNTGPPRKLPIDTAHASPLHVRSRPSVATDSVSACRTTGTSARECDGESGDDQTRDWQQEERLGPCTHRDPPGDPDNRERDGGGKRERGDRVRRCIQPREVTQAQIDEGAYPRGQQ